MEQKEIKVRISDEVLKGVYSNFAQVVHTQEEFVIDFMSIFPPQGVAVSKVVMSPGHFKRFVKALSDNLRKYEEKFGRIEESEIPEKTIGFQTKS